MLMDGWTDWTVYLETFYLKIRRFKKLFQTYF